jgi:hypothetical protein
VPNILKWLTLWNITKDKYTWVNFLRARWLGVTFFALFVSVAHALTLIFNKNRCRSFPTFITDTAFCHRFVNMHIPCLSLQINAVNLSFVLACLSSHFILKGLLSGPHCTPLQYYLTVPHKLIQVPYLSPRQETLKTKQMYASVWKTCILGLHQTYCADCFCWCCLLVSCIVGCSAWIVRSVLHDMKSYILACPHTLLAVHLYVRWYLPLAGLCLACWGNVGEGSRDTFLEGT